MATRPIDHGRASALPLGLLAQSITMLTRSELEALTERLIDHLDEIDGDPDLEEDDPPGQCDEDEINTGSPSFAMHGQHDKGPGCPISDPDCGDDHRAAHYGIDQTRTDWRQLLRA